MKIRVISDLHIDVNEDYPLNLHNKDTFTIVAGDTAGDPRDIIGWIKENVHQGIIITGNHLVYNQQKKTIQELKQDVAAIFPKDGPVTYFDQMVGVMSKEIDGKLFVGTTLYTDYCLDPDMPQEAAMMWACHPRRGMNDFRFGLTKDNNEVRKITPKDYLRWFIESKKELTRIIESNPDKDVVVITHHCPSSKCCKNHDQDMIGLYPSYASNLENFIQEHPNIKVWITGHAHCWNCFKIGNCTVIQNPRGYEGRREADHFNPNTFIDTKTWKIEQKPFRCACWEKQRKVDFERMLYSAAFCL